MSKRFTETTKWEDPWYRKLKPEQKLFWLFLCDNCDNAGVWKVDYELASFQIGQEIGPTIINEINNGKERIKTFENGEILLVKGFIDFQIGKIGAKKLTNLQKNSISLITKYIDFKGFTKEDFLLTGKLPVAYGYKYKGKGKGKGNSKDNGNTTGDIQGGNEVNKVFDFFRLKYKESFGKNYIASYGKEKKIIKELLKDTPETELETLITRFFASDDDFIMKAGYTIGVFKSQLNKLQGVNKDGISDTMRKYMRKE